MKNVIDNDFWAPNRHYSNASEKREAAERVKKLGYKVEFLDLAGPGDLFSFTLRRRGRFGFSTGMTYRGVVTSKPQLPAFALETAQRLVQGISW